MRLRSALQQAQVLGADAAHVFVHHAEPLESAREQQGVGRDRGAEADDAFADPSIAQQAGGVLRVMAQGPLYS